MELNVEDYKGFLIRSGLADITIKGYADYFKKFSIYKDINQEAVDTFLLRWNDSKSRAFIKSFQRYCKHNKEKLNLSKEELERIKDIEIEKQVGRRKQRLPRITTYEEMIKIERAMKKERDKLMLLISFYGALREAELLNIRPFDFQWKLWREDKTKPCELKIIGKGDKERIALIPALLMFRIETWIRMYASKKNPDPNVPFFNISAWTWWENLARYSKIALGYQVNPHSLRHGGATYMLNNGMDIMDVKEILGHNSVASTEIYIHVNKEKLKDKFQGVYG